MLLIKKLKGPDHRASLEPKELASMINHIRETEKILGSKNKVITKSEQRTKLLVRKSLFALKNIKKGEIFTEHNLTTKRPGNGLSPFMIKKLMGKKSSRSYKKDQRIK